MAMRSYSMRSCWTSATLFFECPWASVPGVRTGLGRNHAPVNCQSTSLREANLHLENHFTQRKRGDEHKSGRPGRRRMVRKQSRLPWRGSRGIKNKQKRVAHGVVSSESIDSFPGMTGTLCCRSLVVYTLFPTPLLCKQCTKQFHHLSL